MGRIIRLSDSDQAGDVMRFVMQNWPISAGRKSKQLFLLYLFRFIGGETGIRTLGGLAPTTVFETAPFDHSGTSPRGSACGLVTRLVESKLLFAGFGSQENLGGSLPQNP